MKNPIECLEEVSRKDYRCNHYDLEFKNNKQMNLFFKKVIELYHNQFKK